MKIDNNFNYKTTILLNKSYKSKSISNCPQGCESGEAQVSFKGGKRADFKSLLKCVTFCGSLGAAIGGVAGVVGAFFAGIIGVFMGAIIADSPDASEFSDEGISKKDDDLFDFLKF